jgi:hypothetical protein
MFHLSLHIFIMLKLQAFFHLSCDPMVQLLCICLLSNSALFSTAFATCGWENSRSHFGQPLRRNKEQCHFVACLVVRTDFHQIGLAILGSHSPTALAQSLQEVFQHSHQALGRGK